jgi:hypothetical protein
MSKPIQKITYEFTGKDGTKLTMVRTETDELLIKSENSESGEHDTFTQLGAMAKNGWLKDDERNAVSAFLGMVKLIN